MTGSERATRSEGFTLVETVVVVALLGVVSAVIAAVFVTIARTSPVSQDRADDARSLLGLTTWLPQDVGSASPSGFTDGPHTSACGSGVDPSSQGLLQLTWSEGGATLVADYRFVLESSGLGRIVRYTCRSGQAAVKDTLTSPLAPIPPSAPSPPSENPAPVDLTMFGTPGDYRGVKFDVIVLDDDGSSLRSLLSLDAYTANIPSTLPPTTTIGTTTTTAAVNIPPFAADLYIELPLDTPLLVNLPATDADGDPLEARVTYADPQLSVSVPSGLRMYVRAGPESPYNATDGSTYTFRYIVNDGTDDSNEAEVVVHVNSGASPPVTSTTTTTTTVAPCAAEIVSVSPSTVTVRPNGRLDTDVVVTITATGGCIPLVLLFDPDTTDADTTPAQLAFGASTSVTIGKNDYVWQQSGSTPWTFQLALREGVDGDPSGTDEDTANLVVAL